MLALALIWVWIIVAAVRELRLNSLAIRGLCVFTRLAIFSASLRQASSCNSDGDLQINHDEIKSIQYIYIYFSVDCTTINMSCSTVRYPLSKHCASWICLSKAFKVDFKFKDSVVPFWRAYKALSICFLEYNKRTDPPQIGQQAPGGVMPVINNTI